jgi:hypothetical protein
MYDNDDNESENLSQHLPIYHKKVSHSVKSSRNSFVPTAIAAITIIIWGGAIVYIVKQR